jgi:hypothetical protein
MVKRYARTDGDDVPCNGPLSYFRGGYLQMGNAWITDLRHFLNEDGSLANMPNRARTLAEYFGHIVKGVTTRQKDALATGVRCRKRPRQRRCPGEIIAFIDEQEAISWSCPVCEDNGVISGWKGTLWDWSVNA